MKRLAMLCVLCIAFSGCGGTQSGSGEGQPEIDASSIAQNTETIEKILSENGRNYDKESVNFGNDFVISNKGDNFGLICAVSNQAGIKTDKLEKGAQQTMLATVTLRNDDMSDGGTAYFSFSKRELLCGYFVYNNAYYSLDNKYPFEYQKPFSGSESKEKTASFDKNEQKVPFEDVKYIYGGDTAVVSGSAIIVYNTGRNGLKKAEEIDFGSLAPADVVIGEKYMCVLLDSYEKAEALSASDYEDYEEEDEIINTKSEKIVFVDKEGEKVLPDLGLDLSVYTSAAIDGNMIAAARNSAVDLFAFENGAWVKKQRLGIECSAEQLRIADIDGDGENEYIISDGINISVYKKNSQLQLAWSTKFTTSRIKDIFVGDLNGDGISEIYANELYSDNSTGFALRYILTNNGFEVSGGGIVSGASAYYAVGDIDGDGKCDYAVINDGEAAVNYMK